MLKYINLLSSSLNVEEVIKNARILYGVFKDYYENDFNIDEFDENELMIIAGFIGED